MRGKRIDAARCVMLWFQGLWLSENKTDENLVSHTHEEQVLRTDTL